MTCNDNFRLFVHSALCILFFLTMAFSIISLHGEQLVVTVAYPSIAFRGVHHSLCHSVRYRALSHVYIGFLSGMCRRVVLRFAIVGNHVLVVTICVTSNLSPMAGQLMSTSNCLRVDVTGHKR